MTSTAFAEPTAHADMQSISLQWLLLARALSRTSPAEACIRLGLDKAEVELLANADMSRLQQWANQGRSVFRVAFEHSKRAPLSVAG